MGDGRAVGGPEPRECQHCETITLCDVQEEESPGAGEEVPWTVVEVLPDPDSDPGRGYLFRMSPADDPSTVGIVRVTSGTEANTCSMNASRLAHDPRFR